MFFWYFSGSWKNIRIISPIFSMNKFRQSKVKDVFFPQIQAEHVGFHSSKNFQNWLLVSHYIKKYWLFGGLMCLETINDHEVWAVWQWRTHRSSLLPQSHPHITLRVLRNVFDGSRQGFSVGHETELIPMSWALLQVRVLAWWKCF